MKPITAITNARVLTLAGAPGPRRGEDLHGLGLVNPGTVHLAGDRIARVTPGTTADPADESVIDAHGDIVMPAFVDCHTHACWAGQRFDEFEMKLAGASYLEILQAGGGIMSTVRAVRAATESVLRDGLRLRLRRMAALGTGTAEVKSGYGLQTEAELRMLRAITAAAALTPQTIVPTFLGAHAVDADQPDFVQRTISETLPAVVEAFPGITCDAYCEQGAWSLGDAALLFEAAIALGCPIRVHADQFNALGMTRLAVDLGAVSVDHLEATGPVELQHLAASDTIGVALPCSGFHVDGRYAPTRAFVDAGGALAIATNYNPGSAPSPSMPFTIALACRRLGLTPAEAIVAGTFNAACVLRLQGDLGSLEAGKRADLQVLDTDDERELGYEFATAGPRMLVLGSRVVHRREADFGRD